MSTNPAAEIPTGDQPKTISKKRNQLMGLLVIVVILAPMVGAYIIFKTGYGLPSGTVNKGELLLPPQPIANLPLRSDRETAVDLLNGEKKWRLLIPGGASCDRDCEQRLYLTRQVHTRLLEKAHRVQRIYINVDAALESSTAALISEEHPQLTVVYTEPGRLRQFLAGTNSAEDPIAAGRYFLMDQEGFVMMSYTAEHTGKELLDDLKRLLKYSYEK